MRLYILYRGWRSQLGEYTERAGHTGDEESIYSHEARFEHPARTWASVTHKQFSCYDGGDGERDVRLGGCGGKARDA